ncbi:uncharacterized protein LOC123548586 [Mercenaria mercenaria]|uniref:uncharacterized protein LOC123548586 n=1 Tax=Mercenaria mercenaria TaxID=6596 RepID=UPI00234F52BB|nr:uncharacterized protein LOC123548586 [Mercenaria mercenaria]
MASEFTEKSVKEFLIANGGRVKNTDLVSYFKRFLNDPARKDEMREKFKNYVNTLATIKMDDNKEKILMLKKKYREDSGGGKWDARAQSEPPSAPTMPEDRTDGVAASRVKSDGNLSASDVRLSSSTLASTNDTASLGSGLSSSSSRSLSSVGQEEDSNASVLSVKERAKHLNRIESESEIQKVSSSNLGAVRKKDHRKVRDPDGDDSSSDSYSPLSALEKDWLVKCSASEYHLMNELLSKNPHLASVKEFTSTALHWAAKKGKPEVIKMLLSKPGVYVNQRTVKLTSSSHTSRDQIESLSLFM